MYQSNEIPTTEDFILLLNAFQAEETTKEQRRQVRFAPFVTSSPANPLAFEELKEFWYSPNELCIFKMEARQLVRGGAGSIASTLAAAGSNEEDSLRGLEHTAPQRQKHRYMTIRCTLSAARRGMSADEISFVARKCTEWNIESAFVQACHDYAQVYRPEMISIMPQIRSSPPEFPFAVKSKRCANVDENCRNVRRRMTVQ